ncbi:unnamed protein product [Lota lota]
MSLLVNGPMGRAGADGTGGVRWDGRGPGHCAPPNTTTMEGRNSSEISNTRVVAWPLALFHAADWQIGTNPMARSSRQAEQEEEEERGRKE